MSVIDRNALIEMCGEIDLLEYAERTTGLEFQRRGNDYYTSCPSHSDSTPSLCISPDVNLYYCFSCHKRGNIIHWMMDFEGLSFSDAVDKVSEMTGTDIRNIRISNSLKFFKDIKYLAEKYMTKPVERQVISYDYYNDNFEQEIPEEWVNEGISPEVMREFDIRVDNKHNRICYPIYDNEDRLIGVKGRTRYEDYNEHGYKKYMNYTKIKTTDFFVGMKHNRETIKETKTAIIFEGIKSGLKLATWGEQNNWLAAETDRLNHNQIKILIGLGVKNVILAFDRDTKIKDIQEFTRLLKRFCNVYVVRDRYNKNRLLPGDKDSPVDAGLEVWKQLLKEKVRI